MAKGVFIYNRSIIILRFAFLWLYSISSLNLIQPFILQFFSHSLPAFKGFRSLFAKRGSDPLENPHSTLTSRLNVWRIVSYNLRSTTNCEKKSYSGFNERYIFLWIHTIWYFFPDPIHCLIQLRGAETEDLVNQIWVNFLVKEWPNLHYEPKKNILCFRLTANTAFGI